MVDVPATQCRDRVRIDPLDPNASFLIEKLRGTQPVGCGQAMPPSILLTGVEIGCIQRWVFEQTIGLDGGLTSPDDMGAEEVDMRSEEVDMGTSTVDLGATVDCAPIDAADDGQVCAASARGCEVLALNMVSCDDTCALADLSCVEAFDNVAGECAGNDALPLACDDATRADLYCVCQHE